MSIGFAFKATPRRTQVFEPLIPVTQHQVSEQTAETLSKSLPTISAPTHAIACFPSTKQGLLFFVLVPPKRNLINKEQNGKRVGPKKGKSKSIVLKLIVNHVTLGVELLLLHPPDFRKLGSSLGDLPLRNQLPT